MRFRLAMFIYFDVKLQILWAETFGRYKQDRFSVALYATEERSPKDEKTLRRTKSRWGKKKIMKRIGW